MGSSARLCLLALREGALSSLFFPPRTIPPASPTRTDDDDDDTIHYPPADVVVVGGGGGISPCYTPYSCEQVYQTEHSKRDDVTG